MTQEQLLFVRARGSLWHKAMAAAAMKIRGDDRLVGLLKIREAAIEYAAFKSFESSFSLPTMPGALDRLLMRAPSELVKLVDTIVEEAAAAARKACQ